MSYARLRTTLPPIKQRLSFLMGLVLVTQFTPVCHAVGLGIDVGSSDENWPGDDNVDRETFHVGAVLDTAVASPSVFNYRLGIGMESSYLNNDSYNIHYSGMTLTQTFGLRLLETARHRLWLGPQVKLTAYDEFQDRHFFGNKKEYDGFIRGYGAGLVVGYDLILSRPVTLSFTGGTRYMRYTGHYDRDAGPGTTEVKIKDDVAGNFLGFAALFHLQGHD